MGVTGAGIHSGLNYLANGANMSYSFEWRKEEKSALNNKYASGDDMFLVQKAASEGKVTFLKSPQALVFTYPEKDLSSFFRQRFRWAGKTGAYTDRKLQGVAVLVFLVNMLLLGLVAMSFYNPAFFSLFLFSLFVKFIADILFLYRIGGDFGIRFNPGYLFLSLLFYPVYYFITGIRTLLPIRHQWKDRKIK
jgi:cellulose synthase/poly-beta-1,6-N-acetylglucosamine synthase-like glycosyltransferase